MKRFGSYIFDLDGVITDTRSIHAKAWELSLNEFLERQKNDAKREEGIGDYREFSSSEYWNLLDGMPRKEGIINFLNQRKIMFNESKVEEISWEKNLLYIKLLEKMGIKIIRDSLIFIHNLKKENIPVGLVSSSMNAHKILINCGIEDLFDVIITPIEGNKKNLKGKPSPDYFLEAASLLSLRPSECCVIEDSLSGVEAAMSGGFGEIIGMDFEGRLEHLDALKDRGAKHALDSLLKLDINKTFKAPPSILGFIKKNRFFDKTKSFFLFLDFDGTLSPIVNDPSKAEIIDGGIYLISELSQYFKICVMTGRDTEFIRKKIPLPNLIFAASHGFEISLSHDVSY